MTWREALSVHRSRMLSAAWLHFLSCWLAMRLHGGLRPRSACCDGSVRSSNKISTECTQSFTRGIADSTLTHRSGTSRQCCSKVMIHLDLRCRGDVLHHEQVRSHSTRVKIAKVNLNRLSGQCFKPGNPILLTAAYCCRMGSLKFCGIPGTFTVVPLHTLFLCLIQVCVPCSTGILDKQPVLCQSSMFNSVPNSSMLCKERSASLSSYDRLCSTGKGSHQLSQRSQAQRFVSLSVTYIYTVCLTPETLGLYLCA